MRHRPFLRSSFTLTSLVALCGVLAVGCASTTSAPTSSVAKSSSSPSTATAPTSTAPSSARTVYPVTIEDCGGRKTTYDKAPERVVTLDPSVAESLLLLGLKDRIVGFTEFQTPDQRWPVTQADMDSLKVINKDMNYPSKEAVVAENPDLVTSIYPSALVSNETLPDRAAWASMGVNTYLMGGECDGTAEPVTDFSQLYQDLRNFGVMFDVQDRAEAAIADLQSRVTAAQSQVTGATSPTVWTYSGEKDPYPSGAGGSANAVITLAGAKNAFADIPLGYDAVGWEQIVSRNPDVVWVMSSAGAGYVEEAQGIEKALEADTRLSNVPAVKNKAYVVISYNEGGVITPRNVDALEQMIAGLKSFSGEG